MAIFWWKLDWESRNHSSNDRPFFWGRILIGSNGGNGSNVVTNEKYKKKKKPKEYISRYITWQFSVKN